MRDSFLIPVLALLALSACQPVPPAPAEPAPEADQCGATGYRGLIGQPRTVLDSMRFPIGTRTIGPSDAITSDYRPQRLNIEYGSGGLIEKVSCY
ncbi:MAG: I78 family peptidase inhibitor [Paracoccus sp. (in: a-proteobacteria)]|uniref:I78 family peptidase inhibitor n=1 Tax=Paracoccus sp. TaxID=267 RepID=UPI0026DFCAA9|nr:I78 family peptidase inhibitor [Paracoccus sp. (in: a-proteobacteria)]MDO5632009.1 I78 family peptidase inhibitor [Paracoccus sp. (in: a-proteobacteria)]